MRLVSKTVVNTKVITIQLCLDTHIQTNRERERKTLSFETITVTYTKHYTKTIATPHNLSLAFERQVWLINAWLPLPCMSSLQAQWGLWMQICWKKAVLPTKVWGIQIYFHSNNLTFTIHAVLYEHKCSMSFSKATRRCWNYWLGCITVRQLWQGWCLYTCMNSEHLLRQIRLLCVSLILLSPFFPHLSG